MARSWSRCCPRHSAFVRGDPMDGTARNAQVVAANIDTVFVTQSFENGPNLRRLERELVLAFESGAEPVIVLTKADLVDEPDRSRRASSVERASGAPVIVTSAVTGARDRGAARAMPRSGRTVALIGASGVGKSTLVNRLVGADVQATGAVRATRPTGPAHHDRARARAAARTAACSSTRPGCARSRSGLPTRASGARSPTSRRSRRDCRFHDCAHDREPGCAVQLAVARGEIDAARVEHYRELDAELDRVARGASERERATRKRTPAPRPDARGQPSMLARAVGDRARARAAGAARAAGTDGRRGRRAAPRRCAGERRDREVFGSGVAGGDRGRRAGAGRERVEHRRVGHAVAGRRQHLVGSASTDGPVGVELGAHAVDEPVPERVQRRSASNTRSTVSSASSRASGKRSTRSHCSTDAPSTSSISRTSSFTRSVLGEHDRELVDRDVLAAFEHVDADDVGADRADARRDETERAGPVGKPHAHDEAHAVAGRRRVLGSWSWRRGYDAPAIAAVRQRGLHTVFSVESARCPARTSRGVLRDSAGDRIGLHETHRDPRRDLRSGARRASHGRVARPATSSASTGCSWSSPAIRGRSASDVDRAAPRVRYEMLVAALDGVDGLEASRIELDRDGPTYTIDTVEQLASPGARARFSSWAATSRRASPRGTASTSCASASRSRSSTATTSPFPIPRAGGSCASRFRGCELSSTDLRDRVAGGRADRLPRPDCRPRASSRAHELYRGWLSSPTTTTGASVLATGTSAAGAGTVVRRSRPCCSRSPRAWSRACSGRTARWEHPAPAPTSGHPYAGVGPSVTDCVGNDAAAGKRVTGTPSTGSDDRRSTSRPGHGSQPVRPTTRRARTSSCSTSPRSWASSSAS